MKKGLLLLVMMVMGVAARPCQCDEDYFCSYYDNNSIVVYGYKIGNVDTAGISFKVIDSWGAITTDDTITIWNDSIIAWTMSGGAWYFLCADDTKENVNAVDTFLLNIKLPYAGAAYSAPGDYLFNHWMCGLDILRVENGVVRDTNWFYHHLPIQAVIEESIADYKDRLVNAEGCDYTYIISGIEKKELENAPKLLVANKQLNIGGSQFLGAVQVNLYNITGQLIYSNTSTETSHNLSALSPALYVAEVVVNGEVYRQKVFVD